MKKVFIGGCDRSGTTFLAGLLAKYEGVVMTPESHFKRNAFNGEGFDLVAHLDLLKSDWRFGTWFEDKESILDALDPNTNYQELYEFFVRSYASRNLKSTKVGLWVDHTPENLEYSKFYSENFDNMYFIHIVRDGRAVAASIRDREWGANTPKPLADYWMSRLTYGMQSEIGNKALRVRYEDLIDNTDYWMKKILEHIKYDGVISDMNEVALPFYTKGQHQLVGKSPDSSRINDWKNTLSTRELEVFCNYTKNMLLALGYEVERVYPAPNKIYLVLDIIKEMFLKWRNNRRYRATRLDVK